jgi:hypothetical protein
MTKQRTRRVYIGRHQSNEDNTAAREQYEPRHAAPEPQPAEEATP